MVSDSITINSIWKGDEEAFKRFFESFYPSLMVIAGNCLNDREAARDIVQDAFVYFWSKREEIYSIPSARYYLYKYVKHRSLNYLRDKQGHQEISENIVESNIVCRDTIIEEESYLAIHHAMESLSQQGQRVIELTLDGYKISEIAELLGVTVNTVKTLKLRAFRVMRKGLDGQLFTLLLVAIHSAQARRNL